MIKTKLFHEKRYPCMLGVQIEGKDTLDTDLMVEKGYPDEALDYFKRHLKENGYVSYSISYYETIDVLLNKYISSNGILRENIVDIKFQAFSPGGDYDTQESALLIYEDGY